MGELEFALTERDFVAATKLHCRTRITRHSKLILALVGIIAVVTILSLTNSNPDLVIDGTLAYLALSLIAGLAGLLTVVYFAVLPFLARTHFRQSKAFQLPVKAFWTHESITYSADWGSTKIPWADFHQWTENRRYLMLFQSDAAFNILPRQKLGEAHAEAIMSMLTDAKVKRV